jgi:dTDP-4-dehydrorhamnose reductase
MKNILILGSSGMAGNIIFKYLKNIKNFNVVGTCFKTKLNNESITLDVYDIKRLNEILIDIKPDYVINCIGSLIKDCENIPSNCIYLNSFLPHLLNEISSKKSIKLINLSTDCVFSGNKGNYMYNDFKDANDLYGKSKSLGEITNNNNALTIRTSIIGPEIKNGTGLFNWFLNLHYGETIEGYKNVYWSGITTLELAKFIKFCIDNQILGLFQISNNYKISKFDLLNLIKRIWNRSDITILSNTVKSSDKSLVSSLNYFGYEIPSYSEMLLELLNFIEHNEK